MRTPLAIGIVFAGLLLSPPAQAQFTPSVETSFGTLTSGALTPFSQDVVFNSGEVLMMGMVVEFDTGSVELTGAMVGDPVGLVTANVAGLEIEAGIEVTSVGGSTLNAEAIVTFVDPGLLGLLLMLGIPDPTGTSIYSILYENNVGDGLLIDVAAAGALADLTDVIPFGVLVEFSHDLLYEVPAGAFTVTTILTSFLAEVQMVVETFEGTAGGGEFIRGDADGNGIFNGLTDGLIILSHQFTGGPPPPCFESGDADGDGLFNGLTDGVYVLSHQFTGGPPPPAPYPQCGADPDPAGSLGCISHPGCP